MRGREFKDALFTQFAQIASAFASPKRIEIIDLLAQGERHVEALAREAGLTVANTSRHLQVLKAAQLVASRKEGLQVFYRLADPMVLRGYRALQEAFRGEACRSTPTRRRLLRERGRSGAGREGRAPPEGAQTGRRGSGRASPRGVRGGSHRGRVVDAARHAREAPRRVAIRPAGRRLLPRAVLRSRRRSGQAASQARRRGPAPERGLPGVARCRSSRGYRLGQDGAEQVMLQWC